MIPWPRIIQAISQANKSKIPKVQGDSHILDKLALVLQGTNACVAVYVENNNKLLISANCKLSNNNTTFTKYADECMLDYIRGFKEEDISFISQILANDKRLKSSLPFFRKAIKDIKEICKCLIEDLSSYDEIDEISEEIQGIAENYHEISKINEIQKCLEEFSGYIKDLKPITPADLIARFQKFSTDIKTNLSSLSDQVKNSYCKEINLINKNLDNIILQDLKFVSALSDIISHLSPNLPFLQNDHKTITEIDENNLFQTLVELQENWGQYHAEHRLAVNIDGIRNPNKDLDYIGISKYCCPICYYIVQIIYNINVAGNHTDFYYGDSLVGLRLHQPQTQFDIIKGLFPQLEADAQYALNSIIGDAADIDMQDN